MVFVFFGLVATVGTAFVQRPDEHRPMSDLAFACDGTGFCLTRDDLATGWLIPALLAGTAIGRWPARSSSPTTCATSRPTRSPAR
jgi:1,4-dihydroxy-2-naphthoate octaprenyltransferase